MLDWVKEWNTGKTLINGNTVITPKLFAGTKNSDGTVSGIAIGSFTLNTKTSSGTIAAEAVNGIYGFRDGYKTFYVDNGGNASWVMATSMSGITPRQARSSSAAE